MPQTTSPFNSRNSLVLSLQGTLQCHNYPLLPFASCVSNAELQLRLRLHYGWTVLCSVRYQSDSHESTLPGKEGEGYRV